MHSHPTADQLEAFRQRALPPHTLNEVSQHMCSCEECRQQLEARVPIASSRRPFLVFRPQHLKYDDLQAAVDGAVFLSGAQKRHLANCSMCSREFEDLREFASRLDNTPRTSNRWSRLVLYAAAAAVLIAASIVLTHHHATPGAPMIAELNDSGTRIGLDSQGQLHAPGSWSEDDRRILVAALQSHKLAAPPVPAPVVGVDEVFRGAPQGPSPFSVLTPQRETVYTPTPTFRWQPVARALGYQVSVYDSAFHRVAQSPPITAVEWAPSAPLPRGKSYTWVVDASVPGDTLRSPQSSEPVAQFAVLSEVEASGIRTVLQQNPKAHLLLAARFAQAGARDEARVELKQLQAENPEAQIVRELENSLDNSGTHP
jgi:hypothetical protein